MNRGDKMANKDNYYAEYWLWIDDTGVPSIYSTYEGVDPDEYAANDGRPDQSENIDTITDMMEDHGFKGIDEGNHKHEPRIVDTFRMSNIDEGDYKKGYLHKHRELQIKHGVPKEHWQEEMEDYPVLSTVVSSI
jgi:hypothetical protein